MYNTPFYAILVHVGFMHFPTNTCLNARRSLCAQWRPRKGLI